MNDSDGRRKRILDRLDGRKITIPIVEGLMAEQIGGSAYGVMRARVKQIWYDQHGYNKKSFADIEWYFRSHKQTFHRRKARTYINCGQLKRLVEGCRGERQRMFIKFLSVTGLRVSEMIEIELADVVVNGDAAIVSYLAKKTGIECSRDIGRELFMEIKAVFQGRKYLFETGNGHSYNRNYVANTIRTISKSVLGLSISPHVLRHYWSTAMHNIKEDPFKVAAMMGHKNAGSRYAYYVHPEGDAI